MCETLVKQLIAVAYVAEILYIARNVFKCK